MNISISVENMIASLCLIHSIQIGIVRMLGGYMLGSGILGYFRTVG